jgi:hypothetical protein
LIVVAVRYKRLVVHVTMFCDGFFGVVVAVRRCQRLIVHVTMFCDGSFEVVAAKCQLLVVRFAMFRDGSFGVGAVGSLRTVLAYKRRIVVLAIVIGGYRLAM